MKSWIVLLLAMSVLCLPGFSCRMQPQQVDIPKPAHGALDVEYSQNAAVIPKSEVFEVTFRHEANYPDPFFDVTIDVVKKCLSFLRKSGMISTKRSTRGILLKVHNYRHFQDLSSYSGTKPSTKKALRKHEESTTIIKEGKNVIKKEVISTHKKFVKPTEKQIKDYCAKMSYNINAEKFIAHYDSIGWKRGKTPMKSWEATLTTWHLRDKDKKPKIESRQVKWFVYWCYHCNDEYFKKELGNYRCKHNNCQVEMKGDATVGVKLDHTRTIYKDES